jgi:hypothetical protein
MTFHRPSITFQQPVHACLFTAAPTFFEIGQDMHQLCSYATKPDCPHPQKTVLQRERNFAIMFLWKEQIPAPPPNIGRSNGRKEDWTMADQEKNPMQEELELEDLILTDEDGNDVTFQLLDIIVHEDGRYLVLQDPEDENYVTIMQETALNEDESTFTELEDDDLLETIYAIFKERNQDKLEFDDED